MTLILTVIAPEKPFAFTSKARRLTHFCVYVGLFTLLACILPIFPAKKNLDYTWAAGLAPLALFPLMVQSIRPPIKLIAIPKSRDSRWRHLKYSGIYSLVLLLLGIAVAAYAMTIGPKRIDSANFTVLIYATAAILYGVHLILLHRIIVIKPHSRFDAMPAMARYKRLAAYIITYAAIDILGPWIISEYWQWQSDIFANCSLAIVITFFFCAAYGTDGTPFKGVTIFSGPIQAHKEGANSSIRRRLKEIHANTEV
ncbi:hypothetical protein PSDVSF_15730 [Pseudodesulfovibrio sediminis]|uniref:Frag1/DRAM/Sfk1 family protein n=2 Tax=Pseudodesulfovibrio sediminis TaxID=2810563 RepID=A0ABM7P5Z4_9BACT|nr:hypothetical protein PSDVSF_15730 [Pseudodesulfovibrio sediminis]